MTMQNARTLLVSIKRSTLGIALVEFALLLPVLLGMGLVALDLANLALANMEVSQAALSLADNASRLGQTDNSSVTPTVNEQDIDSIMSGALRQGESIDLRTKGRLILSSVEHDDASGKQYIHWQRCAGAYAATSKYGNDTNKNGLSGTPLTGVGEGANKLVVDSGSAIMVAEIYYRYEGLFGDTITPSREIHREAEFIIRDDRNLTPGVTGSGGTSSCG
jgi:Flp pilus assembly protein TadG